MYNWAFVRHQDKPVQGKPEKQIGTEQNGTVPEQKYSVLNHLLVNSPTCVAY